MNREVASELGKRIINMWRSGPPLTEWIEELERLDEGQAGTAYARLKRSLEHAPSIARFVAEYNSLNTHDGGNRPPDCGWCDSTGWTATRQHESRGAAYSGVEPCAHCPAGERARGSDVWRTAPQRNFITDAEAERLRRAAVEAPT